MEKMWRNNYFRRALLGILTMTALLGPLISISYAQSPTPNATFNDVAYNDTSSSYGFVVVEGLGSGSCSYPLSTIESTTAYYIQHGIPVITEISPQSGCGSISDYEAMFQSIITYEEQYANAGTYWGGIMVDEESGFGFTASQLESLNKNLNNQMSTTTGISWYYTEDFSGQGDWSQSDYNSIVANSYPAPQVSTDYMVGLVNNSGIQGNMVTWSPDYPYPYNSEAASDSAISGTPYYQFGYYFDNEWVPVD